MTAEYHIALEGELGVAERVAIAYAPMALQPGYRPLLALDAVLQRGALSAREPMLAQVRLAWWRDAIGRLPAGEGHPVICALAADWRGENGVLARLVDAWEVVAVDGATLATLEPLAQRRAEACAHAAEIEATTPQSSALCWTLAALAAHAPDQAARDAIEAAGRSAVPPPQARALRPLAVLDGLGKRALLRGGGPLLGDRLSPLAAMRLGIFGR